MDFGEYSGKTLAPEYPWKQATRKKSQKKTENGTQIKEGDMPGRNIANDHDSAQTQPTGSQQRENNAKERGDPSDCRRAETTSEEKATGNVIQPSSNNNVDENPSPERPQKKSRSRSRSRGRHQQQQQKVSWAHFINPPSAPSNSSPKTQQQQQQEHQQQQQQQQQQISKLEKTVESLRELNSKLMKRLDDCEKRPQHFTGTSLPMSLEERINTVIEQKLERMVDQKIEQRFQQLEHFLEQRLSQITNAMTEKFGNIGTTILKMGEAIDTLTNTISSLVSRAYESDRRLATLEKEREQLRKKPKRISHVLQPLLPFTMASNKKGIGEQLKLWQWNCRSIQRKKQNLLQFTYSHQPDIIALQETETDAFKLRGYETHIAEGKRRTAILIKKQYTTQQHHIDHRTEHTLVEVIPRTKTLQSLFILNMYSPPSESLNDFDKLLNAVKKITKGQQLIVLGDFNAPHVAWGYHVTRKKGNNVHDAAQQHGLTLWNDPQLPTRVGNSVSTDTSPDLTFSFGIRQVQWTRLDETLGSDHYIVQLVIQHYKTPLKTGQAKITDWTAFRKHDIPDVQDIEEWTKQVIDTVAKHTKTVKLSVEHPDVDPHLLHMWEARTGLLKRWTRQKRNRKLRLRIAALTRQAEEYAEDLARQNWNRVCDELQGTLSNRRTWAILRKLLAKTEPRTTTKQNIQRLIHNFQGTEGSNTECLSSRPSQRLMNTSGGEGDN
ncbi:hypothetical protein HPB50_005100 [Hyalomma asiaticum]|uniref:Uncharacterized protein n=1 Tax=Hyalomma asiaticum TaxID=266040 RepID=A0ACB7SEQ3_HYAAI|nr:hypothetical protein HPB50_005100 [Hyalomma asiaticum]